MSIEAGYVARSPGSGTTPEPLSTSCYFMLGNLPNVTRSLTPSYKSQVNVGKPTRQHIQTCHGYCLALLAKFTTQSDTDVPQTPITV